MHNEFFALSKLLYVLDKWGHVPLKHGVQNIYVSGSDGHRSATEWKETERPILKSQLLKAT